MKLKPLLEPSSEADAGLFLDFFFSCRPSSIIFIISSKLFSKYWHFNHHYV